MQSLCPLPICLPSMYTVVLPGLCMHMLQLTCSASIYYPYCLMSTSPTQPIGSARHSPCRRCSSCAQSWMIYLTIHPSIQHQPDPGRCLQGVYKQMVELMRSLGVESAPGEGAAFDPNVHEAIMREEDEQRGGRHHPAGPPARLPG